jgi:hypothetical protein
MLAATTDRAIFWGCHLAISLTVANSVIFVIAGQQQHGNRVKILTTKHAKYGFGRLIDLARTEPVAAKHGRSVVVVLAVDEYERLRTRWRPLRRAQKKREGVDHARSISLSLRSSSLTQQAATQTVPERQPRVGELVQVRSRRWLVDEVIEPKSPLVRLSCADDDAQEQALEVLWDYELDRLILEEEGWADLAAKGFDQPRQFAAFLHTLRWNCVTATDPNLFQAPFRAGIKIDAYQMEPLRKALRLPRVNLFIADDTGLGKTIEAGLIARELLLRKKAKTIVVATPSSVLEQWKAELEERFGLVFELLDRAYLTRMRRERASV